MKPSLAVVANVYVKAAKIENRIVIAIKAKKHWWLSCISASHPAWVIPFLFCSHYPPAISGSAAIAIRTPSEIVLGADSIGIVKQGGKLIGTTNTICKIARIGSVFFVHTGLTEYPKTNFQVTALALEADRKGVLLVDKVKVFEDLMLKSLRVVMEHMRTGDRSDRLEYKKSYRNKRVVDVAFFGVEHEVPLLLTRFFNVTSNSGPVSVTVEGQDCPGDCLDGSGYIPLGESEALRAYVTQHPTIFADKGLIQAAQFLLQFQINSMPTKLAAPIDILRVTKDGAEWICKKPCDDKDREIKPCPSPESSKPTTPSEIPAIHNKPTPLQTSLLHLSTVTIISLLLLIVLASIGTYLLLRRLYK